MPEPDIGKRPRPAASGGRESARRQRVLVVDDDREILELTRMILKDAGYEVLTRSSGETALVEARRWEPELILLDINMPGGSGFAVMQRLRASARTAPVPIVAMSATADPVTAERALRGGAHAFLLKPLDLAQLDELIAGLLEDDYAVPPVIMAPGQH